MRTAEKINTEPSDTQETTSGRSYEQESGWRDDSLRHSLLSAPEAYGATVSVPRNTVTVEMNSDTLRTESFGGLSKMVERIQEEPPLAKIHDKGFGRLAIGNFLSGIDRNARRDIDHDKKTANMTFLYDGQNLEVDGETQIPSVAVVHEELSEMQVKELREKLPAGVPIIYGKTNELLDEVGQAEREEGRRRSRLTFGFGHLAVGDTVQSKGSSPRANRARGHRVFDWEAAEDEFDDYEASDSDTRTMPQAIPESAEVQAHARAQEVIAEKTGGRDWAELDEAEQRSVRRQVIRDVHPDREGGDANVFRAAQDSMDLKSREKHE
jgi:hypothetical protein